MTQGAVNRQVRELERSLGVSLFRRDGRAVKLTHAGISLADDLRRDLGSLERTFERAALSGAQRSHVSVGVPPTFGARWLMPRLPRFVAQHPQISFTVRSYSEPFDLSAERVDLAIHFGHNTWPGAQLTPLCPEDVIAVASPALVRAHDLRTPADLLRAPLLQLDSRGSQWEDFFAAHGVRNGPVRAMHLFDQFTMIITAATAGLGVGLVPSYFLEVELKAGVLRHVGSLPSKTGTQYFVVTPAGVSTRAVAALTGWLRKEAKASRAQRAKRPS